MGLHSKVRYEIRLYGNTPQEQLRHIALFAEELHQFIYGYNHDGEVPETAVMPQKFARFVSKAFNFPGYTDDEIFKFIDKCNDRMRKECLK